MQQDRLATAQDLADRYQVKLPTVRAWVRLTGIPVIRIGRLVRFDVAQVDEWLRSGRATLAGSRSTSDQGGDHARRE